MCHVPGPSPLADPQNKYGKRVEALLAINMCVFLVGRIVMCFFLAVGPVSYCECRVVSPPQKVDLPDVGYPGSEADPHVKLELRWTVDATEKTWAPVHAPSFFPSLVLSPPPRPPLCLPLSPPPSLSLYLLSTYHVYGLFWG